jgi:hypothetical protein
MAYKPHMPNDPREALERLCAERGEDFAGLSRLIGRNPAYIQQYIRRGVPRRLHEEERRKLARYFGVAESLLGGPAGTAADQAGLVAIRRRATSASAGGGAAADDVAARPLIAFDAQLLKQLSAASPADLSMIRVTGDSMAPTLNDGDDIMVDHSDGLTRLRDGIYVLRIEDSLLVKRLALHPLGRMVTIQSDNPAYPDWPDCSLDTIDCLGRVVWAGRRVT